MSELRQRTQIGAFIIDVAAIASSAGTIVATAITQPQTVGLTKQVAYRLHNRLGILT